MVARIMTIILTAAICVCWADEPAIVELGDMTVVGMQSLVSMKHNVIKELWTRFMESGYEIEYMKDEGVYVGISWGYKEVGKGKEEKKETQFFHLVGAPVTEMSELPEGFTHKTISAQMYARFVHKGPLSKLGETYDYIFVTWLPESGYLYDTGKCDIELYDERFKSGEEDSEFDIYVPIIEKTE